MINHKNKNKLVIKIQKMRKKILIMMKVTKIKMMFSLNLII